MSDVHTALGLATRRCWWGISGGAGGHKEAASRTAVPGKNGRTAPRGWGEAPIIDPCGSVLHVFLDVLLIVGRRVDRAVAVDHDADRRLHFRIRHGRGRNEIHHLAVLYAADADAAPATRIVIG